LWLYSTYQHPLYPQWSGAPRSPHLVDVPLRAYSGSEAFRAAVTEHWLPALERQQPELILVSAGFDAHAQDPLGDLRLGFDDYRWIGAVIRDLAAQCCGGRVVATLEGGYDLHATARSVESFLQPYLGL
jgi:acetoin utilization deacetylase AcuC-like enzyme